MYIAFIDKIGQVIGKSVEFALDTQAAIFLLKLTRVN